MLRGENETGKHRNICRAVLLRCLGKASLRMGYLDKVRKWSISGDIWSRESSKCKGPEAGMC